MRFILKASQDEFVHALLCELLGKQDIGYYLEDRSKRSYCNE